MTRTQLYTTIANWVNRTDLSDFLPVGVALVEAELNRILVSGNDTEQPVTLSTGTYNAPLPAGIISLRHVLIDQPELLLVTPVSPDELHRQLQLANGVPGKPRYLTVVGSELRVAPIPDQDYLGRAIIEGPLPSILTALDETNWVLTAHPDIYQYGVLTHLAAYLDGDERIPTWRGFFESAMGQLANLRERQRWPGTQAVPLPVVFG